MKYYPEDKVKALIEAHEQYLAAHEQYLAALGEENPELALPAITRVWESKRVELGEKCREDIAAAKNELYESACLGEMTLVNFLLRWGFIVNCVVASIIFFIVTLLFNIALLLLTK